VPSGRSSYRLGRDFGRRLGVRCGGAFRGARSRWRRRDAGGLAEVPLDVLRRCEPVRSPEIHRTAAYAGAVVLDHGASVSGPKEPAGAGLDAAAGFRPAGRVDLRAAALAGLHERRRASESRPGLLVWRPERRNCAM
jgi:hypothetical protein